ncbi:ABC transporter ATP-binding protein [Limisalsivibrio acetivorans]|uniref:ABC transporter ATP-binding protein n=1 Tax=Limisalsivibrio acetivorans TaxID=1304888 RepID=UPI0003B426A2|nr:ABC transporter ATP-binding protein [Limisalsivibrio acetivorans]
MLSVNSLNVILDNKKNFFHILRDVSLNMERGEILGIGGESGSGKTVFAKTLMGLISNPVKRESGEIILDGEPLFRENSFRRIRGKKLSMIFQNPTASLNPVIKIGDQLVEAIRTADRGISKTDAHKKASELLKTVEIQYPEERMNSYPHQLSGGMNQRVMTAMALASEPELLIADEPTTALDVTIQKQIMELLLKLNRERDLSILFISHDIALMQQVAHRCIIMYAGEVMEEIDSKELTENRMRHPYTYSLKRCIPSLESEEKELYTIPGTIVKNTEDYSERCIFAERCFNRIDKCTKSKPELSLNRPFRCHNPL